MQSETGEQIRAENNNSNVQNGFSPVNASVSKQATKLPTTQIANKLSISNLVSGGSALLGKASAPITIVEFGDFHVASAIDLLKRLNHRLTPPIFKLEKPAWSLRIL